MKTTCKLMGTALATGLLAATAQADVLIDFGNQSSSELASFITGSPSNSGVADIGNPTTGSSPTYNNISYGGTAYRAKADFWDTGTQQGLLSLNDTTGADTGWDIELEVSGAKAGDDWSGVYVSDAPSVIKDNYAMTAWEDLLFLQNGGLVTVSITGLDDTKTYDLLLYGSRSGGGTQTWSLTKGTGGSNVVHGTANNTTTAVDWNGINTNGSGEIEFTISASGGDAALNFGEIVEVPEPGSLALLGLGGLLVGARRRRG